MRRVQLCLPAGGNDKLEQFACPDERLVLGKFVKEEGESSSSCSSCFVFNPKNEKATAQALENAVRTVLSPETFMALTCGPLVVLNCLRDAKAAMFETQENIEMALCLVRACVWWMKANGHSFGRQAACELLTRRPKNAAIDPLATMGNVLKPGASQTTPSVFFFLAPFLSSFEDSNTPDKEDEKEEEGKKARKAKKKEDENENEEEVLGWIMRKVLRATIASDKVLQSPEQRVIERAEARQNPAISHALALLDATEHLSKLRVDAARAPSPKDLVQNLLAKKRDLLQTTFGTLPEASGVSAAAANFFQSSCSVSTPLMAKLVLFGRCLAVEETDAKKVRGRIDKFAAVTEGQVREAQSKAWIEFGMRGLLRMPVIAGRDASSALGSRSLGMMINCQPVVQRAVKHAIAVYLESEMRGCTVPQLLRLARCVDVQQALCDRLLEEAETVPLSLLEPCFKILFQAEGAPEQWIEVAGASPVNFAACRALFRQLEPYGWETKPPKKRRASMAEHMIPQLPKFLERAAATMRAAGQGVVQALLEIPHVVERHFALLCALANQATGSLPVDRQLSAILREFTDDQACWFLEHRSNSFGVASSAGKVRTQPPHQRWALLQQPALLALWAKKFASTPGAIKGSTDRQAWILATMAVHPPTLSLVPMSRLIEVLQNGAPEARPTEGQLELWMTLRSIGLVFPVFPGWYPDVVSAQVRVLARNWWSEMRHIANKTGQKSFSGRTLADHPALLPFMRRKIGHCDKIPRHFAIGQEGNMSFEAMVQAWMWTKGEERFKPLVLPDTSCVAARFATETPVQQEQQAMELLRTCSNMHGRHLCVPRVLPPKNARIAPRFQQPDKIPGWIGVNLA